MSRDLVARDAAHLWHPYTQHGVDPSPLPVRSAKGAVLTLEDGREVIDAISSWWATLHGHGEERLIEAAHAQARELDHVIFAGCTHEPAVRLSERLIEQAPKGLTRVFFSDNGSTAVEVALKMAIQFAVHAGEPERRTFVALEGAYHGDTFGAMAVGDPDPFFLPFQPMLFSVERVPPRAAAIDEALARLGSRAAGVVFEPLLQAAGGMLVQPAEFPRALRELCDRHGVPLIADEVMTGFGRTGSLFACRRAGITPDLLCLAKGLTGGTFPLAATLASERFYEAFLSTDRGRAFFHGHTFTAHPVGCAVALASLELCLERDVPARLEAIGGRIAARLEDVARGDSVVELRHLGGVVALELESPGGASGYLDERSLLIREASLARGVLLRPLGNVLYAMPPACTSKVQCDEIADVMAEMVAG